LRGTESVLVVDDNADLRALFAGQMRSLGYRVTEAASGDDALALLEGGAGRFDFLLSDIMMPGKLNGVDLAKVARTRWPELRVLLISGHSGPAAVEEEARAFPLLHKPFRKMQLAQAVRLALASGMVAQADD
jgi:CheY-like chemotaxis protein